MKDIKVGNFVRVGKKTNPREAKIIKIDDKISCDNVICPHNFNCDECIFEDDKLYDLKELKMLGRLTK
jgi:hypothetical protein|nr:MAG TPA: hypothetical protein [Caudoviricetes sp.]